jgi:peptidoglycan/xylan/chitin deacetylase (PgdA/CDA1 family)
MMRARMRLVDLIRGPSRPTRAQLRHRRRRARALVALAVIALLLGVAVGAGGGKGTPSVRASVVRVGFYGNLRTLAGAGRGSLDLEQRAQEDAAIGRVLSKTPFVRNGGGEHRELALTFDDGPSQYTDGLLDVLQRLHVPATFFVLGREVKANPNTFRRLVDAGMTIGNHSWAHPNFEQLSEADQTAQVVDTARELQNAGAANPRLFRPPYGAYNATTNRVLGRARELSVLWSVDSEDYTLPGVDGILQNVLPNVQPGAIVLMHDGGGVRDQTIAAVQQIVPALRREGYRFVSVPRLLLDNPPQGEDTHVPENFNQAGAG